MENIVATVTLDTLVVFHTIVTVVITLIALLTSAPVMWLE